MQETLENTKNLKSYLGEQKEEMGEEKEDLESLVKIQALQKQEKAETKEEQEILLCIVNALDNAQQENGDLFCNLRLFGYHTFELAAEAAMSVFLAAKDVQDYLERENEGKI